jgi:hypothetical protein
MDRQRCNHEISKSPRRWFRQEENKMSLGIGSQVVGFEFAELSTIFFDYMSRSIRDLKAQAKAGVLTPDEFAKKMGDTYEQCADLAHGFSERFLAQGNNDLSSACEAWANRKTGSG